MYMRKLDSYSSLLISLIVFAPLFLVGRNTLNQDISGADLLLAAPIGLHFGLMMAMVGFAKYDSGNFTAEELKAYRILIIGVFVLTIPLWILVVAIGHLSTSVVLSSSAGLLFALYDLLTLVGRLRTVRQLRHMVFLGVLAPAIVACILSALTILYTHWQNILNPVAIFFICRAAIITRTNAVGIKPNDISKD